MRIEHGDKKKKIVTRTYQTNFLILCPSLHDGRVVDTIDNHILYPHISESVLILQVVGDVLGASSRSKSSWKAHQKNRFVLAIFHKIVLGGRKAVMKFDRWQLVSDGCKGSKY